MQSKHQFAHMLHFLATNDVIFHCHGQPPVLHVTSLSVCVSKPRSVKQEWLSSHVLLCFLCLSVLYLLALALTHIQIWGHSVRVGSSFHMCESSLLYRCGCCVRIKKLCAAFNTMTCAQRGTEFFSA